MTVPLPDPEPDAAFEWTQASWGRALRCRHLGAPHLFTSRDLMLRGDDTEWAAVAASLGVSRERLLLLHQVHGTQVAVARAGQSAGWDRPHADIVITDD